MKKILILLVSAVLISIPVAKTIFPSGDFISGLIGLVFLGALTQINRRKKLEWFLIILIGLGIFSLYAFSILWSSNLAAGFKGLETKLSLAVIPLSLGLIGPPFVF